MTTTSEHGVDIVTASAGTGKTYRLTGVIEGFVAGGQTPETIMATTFTVKAAEELRERIRERLLQNGHHQEAIRLLGAKIGTVNGVCGGLIAEHALALGLSPVAEVISEATQVRVFNRAADAVIARYADRLDRLARKMGQDDWRADLAAITALARSNDLKPDRFPEFIRHSVEGFAKLLAEPRAGETAAGLDAALGTALAALLVHYPDNEGLTKTTSKALDEAREFQRKKVEDLAWGDWAKLAKLKGAKADDPNFEPVREAAAAFARHPRLVEDVTTWTDLLFTCAGEALDAYESHKRKWGLVDFVDQERVALSLVEDPARSAELAERIETVCVDEFQDTSPLQLAVFVGLSRIARRSVWVGDPKQAIYGFRGTDPDLISRIAPKILSATGGRAETLGRNFRSRPGLVNFVNDAFSATFLAMGLPAQSTRVAECNRTAERDGPAPLGIWHLAKGNAAERASAIASGIFTALSTPATWPVEAENRVRPAGPGDVAVLCATNDRCLAVAAELARFGLKVALERDGLFATPEVMLAIAATRWCADRRDSLALAEMSHLLATGDDQPAWFEASLNGRAAALEPLVPMIDGLRATIELGGHKSPRELLDAVLVTGGVADAVRRWGNAPDRLRNIEALRALAVTYEDECSQARSPATMTDFCAWLGEQSGMQPASRDADAVTVLTYHRSKGLEWPVVILTDLDRDARNSPFGLHVESTVAPDEVDWRHPLADRRLRLWPWPFGAQKKDVHLDTTGPASAEGRETSRIEREERARVLYVGATRARDHLVLALPNAKEPSWAWLDDLKSTSGGRAVDIPSIDDDVMLVDGVSHPVRVSAVMPLDPPDAVASTQGYRSPAAAIAVYEPLAVTPSSSAPTDARIVEEIDLGHRLPFAGSSDIASVGEALHRFLAADDPTRENAIREAMAKRLLANWGVTAVDPRDVVEMSTRFFAFVEQRWPGAILHREAPILQRVGEQTISGRLDAIVETDDEIVIIDHKSFPGGPDQWPAQVKKHAGQLSAYADVLDAHGGGSKQIRLALHLPVSGTVLVVTPNPSTVET